MSYFKHAIFAIFGLFLAASVSANSVDDFMLFSADNTLLGRDSRVLSGDLGSNGTGNDVLELKQGVTTPNGVNLRADEIKLGSDTSVGNVFYNSLDAHASAVINGTNTSSLTLPVANDFPTIPSFSIGASDLEVNAGTPFTLASGSYRDLTVKSDAIVILSGGDYYFRDVELKSHAFLLLSADAHLYVEGRFKTANNVKLNPGTESHVLRISQDGTPDLELGANSQSRALIVAPNAKVLLRPDSVLEGRVIADEIETKQRVVLFYNPFDGSVTPPSTADTFSLFAKDDIVIGKRSFIVNGKLGANSLATGAIHFKRDATTAEQVQIFANDLDLDQDTEIGHAFYNTVTAHSSAVINHPNSPVPTPIVASAPTVVPPTTGDVNLDFSAGTTSTASPDAYQDVVIRQGATVTFEPGEYHMESLDVKDGAILQFTGKTIFRVSNAVDIRSNAQVNWQLAPEEFCLLYSGTTQVELHAGAQAGILLLLAPDATVVLKDDVEFEGAIWADRIDIREDVTVDIIDLAPPSLDATPAGGTYPTPIQVTLTADEPATIYYTLDGSTPTTASAVASGPINVDNDSTLQFFGVDAYDNASAVQSEVYVIGAPPPLSSASPVAGAYAAAVNVVLSSVPAADIRYTTDGSTPTVASPLYTAPIAITTDTTLKFFATGGDGSTESIKTADYVIDTVAPTTTAAPLGGSYPEPQSVALTATDDKTATSIYYTTDGSTPTTSSTLYTTPVAIAVTTTLKFFAVDSVGNQEAVQTETYTITGLPPSADPESYLFFAKDEVTVGRDASIAAGDIGSNGTNSTAILLKQDATTDAGSTLRADKIKLNADTTVGNLHYNVLDANASATILGTQDPSLILPVAPTIPTVPAFTPGSTDVDVPANGSHTLAAGSYQKVTVDSNGVLILSGGDYYLDELIVKENGCVSLTADSTVYVQTKVKIRRDATLNYDFQPARLEIQYAGTDTLPLRAGSRSKVLILAPDAKVTIGDGAIFEGRVIADNIHARQRSVSTYNPFDGSVPPPSTPDSFTLFADTKLTLEDNVEIAAGKIGSNGTTNNALLFQDGAFTDPSVFVFSDRLKLDQNVVVGHAFYNVLLFHATAQVLNPNTPVDTPIVEFFPDIDPFSTGSTDLTVPNGATTTINPNSYRDLDIGDNATVTVVPGDYFVDKLLIGNGANLLFSGPTTFYVDIKTDFGNNVEFNNVLPCQDVRILHAGTQTINIGNTGDLHITRLQAPDAKVDLGQSNTFFGTIWADIIEIGQNSVFGVLDIAAPVTTATPPGGIYTIAQSVVLATDDPTDTIYFTTDGSTPTTSSTVYTGPINIAVDTTLKFFAVDTLLNAEAVQTEDYIIDGDAPVVTVLGIADGDHTNQDVTPVITVSDAHAVTTTITLDGNPFTSGTTITAEGDYQLVVSSTDIANNNTTVTINFTIDKTAPVVTVTGVTDGQFANTDLTPVATFSDSNLDTTTLTLDGNPFVSGTTITAEGDYVLLASASDLAGNTTNVTVNFTIDKTAPAIVIAGVSDGQFANTDLTPTISITDPNPDTQTITLNGNPFVSGTTITAEGSYTLAVSATDLAGNTANSSISFTIDKTDPVIAITGVTDGQIGNADVTPVITITEANPGSETITLNGNPFVSGTTVTADGAYTLAVNVTDAAGNNASAVVTFTIDKTDPIITITGVTDGQFANTDLTPVITITEPNIDTQTITLNGNPFVSGTTVTAEGAYTLAVNVTDLAGNTANATVTFTIDKTDPVIAITGVTDGQFSNGDLTPVITITEANPGSETITLNGNPFVSGTTVTAEGAYTLLVDVTDAAGNNVQQSVTFTIDKTDPVIVITGVTDGQFSNADLTPVITITEANVDTQTITLNGNPFVSGTTVTAEGAYTLAVAVTDLAGNTANATVTFTIDKTAPVINIAGVVDGQFSNVDVTPTITVTEANPDTQTVTLNGNPFTSGTTITAEGSYVLAVSATDLAGNSSNQSITFTIDKTDPVIVITGVTDGQFSNVDLTPVITITEANVDTQTLTLNGNPFVSGTTVTAENAYALVVSVSDLAGNTANATVNFTIDKTAPAINIAGVVDGQFSNVDVTPTITVTEANPDTQTITLDGNPFTSGTTITAEGTYVLTVSATDLAGNSANASITFTIDKTDPVINITGVSDGQFANTDLTPVIAVTEANPDTQTITLDGNPFVSGTTITAEGTYVLVVSATDLAGNTANASVTFTIDKTAPVITITGVTDGQFSNFDNTPVITITEANPDTESILLNGNPFVSGTTITAEDDYTLAVSATDLAGNTAGVTIVFTIDKTAPVIIVTGVAEGQFSNADLTPDIQIIEDNLDTSAITLNGNPFTSGTTITAEGVYALAVSATDLAGNAANLTVNFTIDKTAPVIAIAGVSDGQFANTDLTPTITITEANPDTQAITLDGNPFVSGTTVTAEGTYVLAVSATDLAGNNASETVTFTIDKTDPVIAVSGVTDGQFSNIDVTPIITITEANVDTSTITLNGNPFVSGTVVTAEGAYTLAVSVTDLAGNTANQTVNFTIDKTDPVIAIAGASDGQFANTDLTPTITITDANANPALDSITLDGNPFVSGTTITAEGIYVLAVSATDLAGNTANASITFTIDKTDPVIAVAGVTEGQFANTDLTPVITITEANPGTETITLNGNPFVSGTTITAEGAYALVINVTDAAGNNASQTVNFTIDKTAPAIVIAGVTDGQFANTDLTPTITITDSNANPALDSITLDGNPFVSGTTITAEGTYVLAVSATDLAGNTANSSITFTIDKTDPVITITGVSNGQVSSADLTPVIAITEANPGTETITLNGNPFVSGTTVTADGAYALVVNVTDAAGNSANQTLNFSIDKTAPVIVITGATDGQFSNVDLTPVITITEPNVDTSTITLNGNPFVSGTTITTEGSYTLVVDVTDLAGNNSNLSISFTIDKTAPVITVTGVTNGEVSGTNVTPVITVVEANPDSETITLNGNPFVSGSAVFDEGAYTLVVDATDLAGNTTNTTITFTIDQTLPVIDITGVTDGEIRNADVTPVITITEANVDTQTITLNGNPFTSGTAVTAEGTYTLVVDVTDLGGNNTTATVTFAIDKTAPVITITGVSDGQFSNVDLTPIVTFVETNPDIESITLDGNAIGSGTTITADGTYVLAVSATDLAGNTANQTITFTIDKTAPVVVVTGVSDGQFSNVDLTPVITITETNPGTDTILLDGNPFTSGTTITADGTYVLSITSVDAASNQTVVTVNFTVDKTNPAIAVTGINDGDFANADVIPVITITDANANTALDVITLNGDSFVSGTTITDDGVYVLVVTATDLADNSDSVTVNFTVDQTLPSVVVTGIADGDAVNTDVTPTIAITDTNANPALDSITLDGNPFVSGTLLTAEANYVLVISATDLAGNNALETINFTIDKTAPTIDSLIPADATQTVDDLLPVTATYSDSGSGIDVAAVTLSYSGSNVTSSATITASSLSFTPSTPILPGNHNVILNIADLAGNSANQTNGFVLSADSDGDGIPDIDENTNGTDPTSNDSDGDGITDDVEIANGTDPTSADTDNDAVFDAEEATHGTDPLLDDTDGDGLNDGFELAVHGTNPTLVDTDGDGISDSVELDAGSNPLDINSFPAGAAPDLTGAILTNCTAVQGNVETPGGHVIASWDGVATLDTSVTVELPINDVATVTATSDDPTLVVNATVGSIIVTVSNLTQGVYPIEIKTTLNTGAILYNTLTIYQFSGTSAVIANLETDTDSDGLVDIAELLLGSDINLVDTDNGGVNDGTEAAAGLSPTNMADDFSNDDADGILQDVELITGTQINDATSRTVDTVWASFSYGLTGGLPRQNQIIAAGSPFIFTSEPMIFPDLNDWGIVDGAYFMDPDMVTRPVGGPALTNEPVVFTNILINNVASSDQGLQPEVTFAAGATQGSMIRADFKSDSLTDVAAQFTLDQAFPALTLQATHPEYTILPAPQTTANFTINAKQTDVDIIFDNGLPPNSGISGNQNTADFIVAPDGSTAVPVTVQLNGRAPLINRTVRINTMGTGGGSQADLDVVAIVENIGDTPTDSLVLQTTTNEVNFFLIRGQNPSSNSGSLQVSVDNEAASGDPLLDLAMTASNVFNMALSGTGNESIDFYSVDLDIDSDNSDTSLGGIGLQQSDAEEAVEDQAPGKIMSISDLDSDGDGIVDTEDFDVANFFPNMLVSLSNNIDLSVAKVRFRYQAANPNNLGVAGGRLRVWAENGHLARSTSDLKNGGDFVSSTTNGGVEYVPATDFPSPFSGTHTFRFWVEPIRPGQTTIDVEVDPDGDGTRFGYDLVDSIVVTAIKIDVVPYRSGELFGTPVDPAVKRARNSDDLVMIVNNDRDEELPGLANDFGTLFTAQTPGHSSGNFDNDLIKIRLKKLDTGGADLNFGTLTVDVQGAGFNDYTIYREDPINTGVAIGLPVAERSVDLANPTGGLADWATKDITIWIEARTVFSDLQIDVRFTTASTLISSHNYTHIRSADLHMFDFSGNREDFRATVDRDFLLAVAAGTDPGPIPSTAKFKANANIGSPGIVSSLSLQSADTFVDTTTINGNNVTSQDFAVMYTGDALSAAEKATVFSQLGLNVVQANSTDTGPKMSIVMQTARDIHAKPEHFYTFRFVGPPTVAAALSVDDPDDDGIPDYADGYDLDGGSVPGLTDDTAVGSTFTPIQVFLAGMPDVATAEFAYNLSDPAAVVIGGTAPNLTFTPAGDGLRLWFKDASDTRTTADLVVPNQEYTANQLQPDENGVATLYAELASGTGTENVQFMVNGNCLPNVTANLSILSLGVDLDIDTDNNGLDGSLEEDHYESKVGDPNRPGKIFCLQDFGLPGVDQTQPVTLSIAGDSLETDATITITYNYNDPADDFFDPVTGRNNPGPGKWRLSTATGQILLPPGTYAMSDLPFVEANFAQNLGLLMLPANPSGHAELSLRVSVDPDGSGPLGNLASDTVRATIWTTDIDSDADDTHSDPTTPSSPERNVTEESQEAGAAFPGVAVGITEFPSSTTLGHSQINRLAIMSYLEASGNIASADVQHYRVSYDETRLRLFRVANGNFNYFPSGTTLTPGSAYRFIVEGLALGPATVDWELFHQAYPAPICIDSVDVHVYPVPELLGASSIFTPRQVEVMPNHVAHFDAEMPTLANLQAAHLTGFSVGVITKPENGSWSNPNDDFYRGAVSYMFFPPQANTILYGQARHYDVSALYSPSAGNVAVRYTWDGRKSPAPGTFDPVLDNDGHEVYANRPAHVDAPPVKYSYMVATLHNNRALARNVTTTSQTIETAPLPRDSGGALWGRAPYFRYFRNEINSKFQALSLTDSIAVQRGVGPLTDFAWFYNGNSWRHTFMGTGFTHSYDIRILPVYVGNSRQVYLLMHGDHLFGPVDANGGIWIFGEKATLVENTANPSNLSWTLTTRAREVMQFGSDGVINSLTDRNGNSYSISYEDFDSITTNAGISGFHEDIFIRRPQQLSSVSGNLDFFYSATNRMSRVVIAAGGAEERAYEFEYADPVDLIGDLMVKITGPEYTHDFDWRGAVQPNPAERVHVEGIEKRVFKHKSDTTQPTVTYNYGYDVAGDYSTLKIESKVDDWRIDNDLTSGPSSWMDTSLLSLGNSVAAVYGNGTTIAHSYGPDNKIDSVAWGRTFPGGATVLGETTTSQVYFYNYNVLGQLRSETTPPGSTSYTYDNDGNLTLINPSDFGAITMEYDPNFNRMTKTTFPQVNGIDRIVEQVVSATNGDILSRTEKGHGAVADRTWTFTYNPNGLVHEATDPKGIDTEHFYNLKGMLTRKERSGVNLFFSGYDFYGNVTVDIDAEDNHTHFTYDDRDRVLTIEYPANADVPFGMEEYKYTPLDQVREQKMATGAIYAYSFDSNSKPTGCTISGDDGTGTSTNFSYACTYTTDDEGNIIGESVLNDTTGLPDYSISRVYDYAGRTVLETRGSKLKFQQLFDAANRVEKTSDAQVNNVREIIYDTRGNIRRLTRPFGFGRVVNTYDAVGNLIITVDNADNLTGPTKLVANIAHTYDVFNRVINLNDGRGEDWQFTYDVLNNLITRTDPRNNTTTYSYDTREYLVQTDLPITVAGQLPIVRVADNNNVTVSITDLRGKTWTTICDNLQRITGHLSPTGSEWDNKVDAYSNPVKGKMGSVPFLSTNDGLGRTSRFETTPSLGEQQFVHGFAGQSKFVDRTGRETRTVRGAAGTPTQKLLENGASDITNNQDQDTDGRPISNELVDPTLTRQRDVQFNDIGLPEKIETGAGEDWIQNFNGWGLTTSMTNPVAGTVAFTYDGGGLLTNSNENGRNTAVTRDANGNVEKLALPGGITTDFVNNARNVPTKRTTKVQTGDATAVPPVLPITRVENLGYDANNNLTSHEIFNVRTTTFTYDDDSRLESIVRPNSTRTFTYNLNHQVTTDSSGNLTTTYNYDPAARLIGIDVDGNPDYDWDLDDEGRILEVRRGGVKIYNHDYTAMTKFALRSEDANTIIGGQVFLDNTQIDNSGYARTHAIVEGGITRATFENPVNDLDTMTQSIFKVFNNVSIEHARDVNISLHEAVRPEIIGFNLGNVPDAHYTYNASKETVDIQHIKGIPTSPLVARVNTPRGGRGELPYRNLTFNSDVPVDVQDVFEYNDVYWITSETRNSNDWEAQYEYRADGGRTKYTLNGRETIFTLNPSGGITNVENSVLGVRLRRPIPDNAITVGPRGDVATVAEAVQRTFELTGPESFTEARFIVLEEDQAQPVVIQGTGHFADDFDDGSGAAWDSTINNDPANASVDFAQNTTVRSGLAPRFMLSNGADTGVYVEKAISKSGVIGESFYVYIDSASVPSSDNATLFQIETAGNLPIAKVTLSTSGGIPRLRGFYVRNTPTDTPAGEVVVAFDQWIEVALVYNHGTGASDGSFQWWVDDVSAFSSSGFSAPFSGFTLLKVGLVNVSAGAADIIVDNVGVGGLGASKEFPLIVRGGIDQQIEFTGGLEIAGQDGIRLQGVRLESTTNIHDVSGITLASVIGKSDVTLTNAGDTTVIGSTFDFQSSGSLHFVDTAVLLRNNVFLNSSPGYTTQNSPVDANYNLHWPDVAPQFELDALNQDPGLDPDEYFAPDKFSPIVAQGTLKFPAFTSYRSATSNAIYDGDVPEDAVSPLDNFSVPEGTAGSVLSVFFHDANGDGEYDAGEDIWRDLAGGIAGEFDLGTDQLIYGGGDGQDVADGDAGLQEALYYHDVNGSNAREVSEALWSNPTTTQSVHTADINGFYRATSIPPDLGASVVVFETVSYDAAGRVSQRFIDGRLYDYTYDSLGRLVSYTDNQDASNNATYEYDHLGRRIRMTVGNVTTRMVYGGDDVCIEYTDGPDADTDPDTKRIYWKHHQIDRRLGFVDIDIATGDPTFYYYHCDQVGSVIMVTNESGDVVNQYDYDAFGNLRPGTSFETVENRYMFQGREYDAHRGDYYFRMRTYVSEWGQFTGPDWNVNPDDEYGQGSYCAFGNNPLQLMDPDGNIIVPAVVVAIGGYVLKKGIESGAEAYYQLRMQELNEDVVSFKSHPDLDPPDRIKLTSVGEANEQAAVQAIAATTEFGTNISNTTMSGPVGGPRMSTPSAARPGRVNGLNRVRQPVPNSVFTVSGRRIGNFLEDQSILKNIMAERVVYVTSKAEKSALKKALRQNPEYQRQLKTGSAVEVRYLHGYKGDVVNSAARQLKGSKRVSGHVHIVSRRRYRGFQIEIHVGQAHGPHIHIDRGTKSEKYIRLDDTDWATHVPRVLLNDEKFLEQVKRAAFYGLGYTRGVP